MFDIQDRSKNHEAADVRPVSGRRALAVLACIAGLMWMLSPVALSGQGGTTHGLTIPSGNFMIYWTPARIAQARVWYLANPGWVPRPSGHEAAVDNAFLYLVTGNTTAAQSAVNWAATFSFYSDGPGNAGRWYGEAQILVFSWLKQLFTADQRRNTIASINAAVQNDLQKEWGGAQDPSNNYNWGYTRNALLWGIASYNESYVDGQGRTQRQIAEGFLDNALVARWQNVTAPFYRAEGRGGSMPEGSHYGPYLLDYFSVPMVSTRLLGRTLAAETNYWKEAVIAQIYATTPKPTNGSLRHPMPPRYQVFSYGDEQDTDGHPPATTAEYGNFMTVAASEWGSTAIAQYARYWLNRVRPSMYAYIRSADANAAQPGLAFSNLPLDYYSAGPGYLYTRDTWAVGASDKPTSMLFQLGAVRGSHQHCDAGSFQIVRNDRWLTRETPGRSAHYADHTGTGEIWDMHVWAHNGITVNYSNLGPYCEDSPRPTVLRLESRPQYAYAAVDLTAYHGIAVAPRIIREFVHVRPFNSLIVFDRVQSTQDVPKTAIIHFPVVPTVTGNIITGTNVSEQLRVTSLTPSIAGQTTSFVVINEAAAGSGSSGTWEPQYRLQIDTRGSLSSYHVNVLQAKSVADSNVTSTLTETSTTFTIRLQRAGQEDVVLTFNKGMTSSGGVIQIGAQQTPFISAVQNSAVTDNGVSWGAPPPPPVTPAMPTGIRIIQ